MTRNVHTDGVVSAAYTGRLGTDPAQIEQRMQQQLSDEARREHAHFVVDNADDNHLLRQVLDLHKKLVEIHASRDRKTP